MKSRILLTATAVGLLCAQPLAAQTAKPAAKPAAAAPAGPWAKVPALPTACYSAEDQWGEKANAAFNAVQQDHYRQNDINSEIQQQANNADPMAVAQRMQQEMMNDPANAQKYLEQMMAQGQQAQAEAPARGAKDQQMENESKAVMKQYEAALEKAMGPGNARLEALLKKYSPSLPGAFNLWMRYGESGEPAWVKPERLAILKQWDQAYVATCAQWWTAAGPIHSYLKRYKDYLMLERAPYLKKLDETKLEQFRAYGVPADRWRSTADYDAAEDYIEMARTLFGQREEAPRCTTERPCQ